MNRREFGSLGVLAGAASLTAGLAADAEDRVYYELRTYELRYDLDAGRLHSFLRETFVPWQKESTGSPVGVFTPSSGLKTPRLLILLQHASLEKITANTDLAGREGAEIKAWREFESQDFPYLRYETEVLKAFQGHPSLEVPSGSGNLFELRTYESKNAPKSAAKIEMFNEAEIAIFRDCGMMPVFFGEGIFGPDLPKLTYMLAFDDMAAREKAWQTFRDHPEWKKIQNEPRWADTVSRIHASFLSGTEYSGVR